MKEQTNYKQLCYRVNYKVKFNERKEENKTKSDSFIFLREQLSSFCSLQQCLEIK